MLAPTGLQVGHGGHKRILGSPGLPEVSHLAQRVNLKSQRGAWALLGRVRDSGKLHTDLLVPSVKSGNGACPLPFASL